jgi:hypothetical protein
MDSRDSSSFSTTAEDRTWAVERRRIERSRHWISPLGPRTRWRKAILNRMLALLDLGLRPTPLYARGRRNALDIRRIELAIAPPGLPAAFDGYRILHVSDTHLDVFPELAEVAHRQLDGLEVDLLALTGDVHGDPRTSIVRSTELLMRALRGVRVRDRRLAILGNHDAAEMAAALEARGFDVLVNRTIAIERAGARIGITGLDDVHNFYSEAALAALRAPGEAFRIALTRATRSISQVTRMAARSACPAASRCSRSLSAADTPPSVFGGRAA